MTRAALILAYFSIIIMFQPRYALDEVDCSEFNTNTTCLMQGCNCAFLICDTDSFCVPANATHSTPVNVDKCQSYEFCYECSQNSAAGVVRCSSGYSSDTVALWKIAVIVLSAVFFVFMVICLVLYMKMRQKKKLQVPKEVTMEVTTEYKEMQE
jgi:hypothetical protein